MQEIVFHSNCPDGIISREIAKVVHPNAVCVPFNYESDFEIRPGQLWVDASPKTLEAKRSVLEQGGRILDHHITAIEHLDQLTKHFPGRVFIGSNDAEIPESGAWLTYNYALDNVLFSTRQILKRSYRELALTVAIGDTFRKDFPEFTLARALASYIIVFGNEFSYDGNWNALRAIAEQMKTVVRKKAEKLANDAILTKKGFAFINDLYISDAADILMNEKGYNVVVGFKIIASNDKHIMRFSIRTRHDFEGAEEALKIAKQMGGGGHLHAHGFEVPYTANVNFVDYLAHWSL